MVTIGTIKIPAKRISEEAMKPVITRECVCVCVYVGRVGESVEISVVCSVLLPTIS